MNSLIIIIATSPKKFKRKLLYRQISSGYHCTCDDPCSILITDVAKISPKNVIIFSEYF